MNIVVERVVVDVVSAEGEPCITRSLVKDFCLSVGYTVLVVLLVWFGLLSAQRGFWRRLVSEVV
ncbi:hypothetical protein E6P09_14820 [Haloferax mediterranei ATCC 33500]|uniref:Uncharacterized protein n=1 Tax=Haloferax mediterranei (strain ATCC 33500 / DSM 1411 / JCM 8866 / NBRC 14739 / NCIMB 2177 / R-4) TaxID=523841 RepID=M0IUB1_HALMT|nr:hypothetical protein BM92_12755 [Haloferax mediterranei ATCC 33500]ELZ99627.1 hypothetical protein C439_13774 [Haloferax mediterranei ATCC 33500]QCQ76476.1 hypothetical protein E6P09_14820 [Haloferax mediterranei ATCC 33500]